jgi:hypothetical protein
MIKPMVIDAILVLKKDAKFILHNNDFDTIEWHDGNPDNITKEQVEEKLVELQEIYESLNYQRKRKPEYPSIEDQLDLLYHKGIDGWKEEIQKVKDKYPKPVVEEPKPELKDGN